MLISKALHLLIINYIKKLRVYTFLTPLDLINKTLLNIIINTIDTLVPLYLRELLNFKANSLKC